MLTDEDTTKLVNKFAEVNKQMFYTKTEMDGKFEEQRTEYSKLRTAVVSFATGTKKNEEEIKAVNQRVSDHESWIKKVVPKVGVEFRP